MKIMNSASFSQRVNVLHGGTGLWSPSCWPWPGGPPPPVGKHPPWVPSYWPESGGPIGGGNQWSWPDNEGPTGGGGNPDKKAGLVA